MSSYSVTESARLKELARYGILDTDREAVFDDIAKLAQTIVGTRVAMVCLIDEHRQWFKAEAGVTELMGDLRETGLEISFCSHAIASDDVMVVADATQDPRFKDNPLVSDYPHVRSYAGAPLIVGDGIRLGTVCVLDLDVRSYTEQELAALCTLRDAAVAHLKLRLSGPDVFVAVCGWCQKLLDPLPKKESSNVTFTHGICEDCSTSVRSEFQNTIAHCSSCGIDFSVLDRQVVTTDEGRWTRCPSCNASVSLGDL